MLNLITVLLVAACFVAPVLAQDTVYYSTAEGETVEWYMVADGDTTLLDAAPDFATDHRERAAEVQPADPLDEGFLEKKYLAIYAVASVVLTFLLGFIPWAWIKADATRDKIIKAVTVAIVLGISFWQFGFAEAWELAIAWAVGKVFLYDGVMKAANIRTHSPAPERS